MCDDSCLTAHKPQRLTTAEHTNTHVANDPTETVLYEKNAVRVAAPVSGPSNGWLGVEFCCCQFRGSTGGDDEGAWKTPSESEKETSDGGAYVED